mmetsp:Transcript_69396/g.192084  ORF Transcript_69396/g.192084 Transcript_69396/m.192084 type:complete len:263 (-) Transcript_69396:64-852(-)
MESSLVRSASSRLPIAAVSSFSSCESVDEPDRASESKLAVASTIAWVASGLNTSVRPMTPDRRPARSNSTLWTLNTLSPRTKLPTPSPKNSVAASESPKAKSSSCCDSLGATASVSCFRVTTASPGVRTPSAPGSRSGNGISSSLGLGGRMSPRKGSAGGRGGVRATTASLIPCRKICRVKMSTMVSTSSSKRTRKPSALSDSKNFNPSWKLSPSSGTPSRSTKAAPSFVCTAPAALFRRANKRDSFKLLFSFSSPPLYSTS